MRHRFGLGVVVLLLLGGLLGPVTAATAADRAGGWTHGDSGKFWSGCRRRYTYDYRVRTPNHDWTLEVWIINPRGKAVHSDGFLGKPGKQGHPKRQRNVRWKMCSANSRPGRYKIRARLTWYDHSRDDTLAGLLGLAEPEEHREWLPVERFRLRR